MNSRRTELDGKGFVVDCPRMDWMATAIATVTVTAYAVDMFAMVGTESADWVAHTLGGFVAATAAVDSAAGTTAVARTAAAAAAVAAEAFDFSTFDIRSADACSHFAADNSSGCERAPALVPVGCWHFDSACKADGAGCA